MRTRIVAVLVAGLLSGCEPESMDRPPEVRFGQAECVQCGMIVSDPRAAGALIVEVDGRRRELAFDDIGDMLAYERDHGGELRLIARYVGDYATGQWIAADTATLLRSDALHTPMGSGIVAFADRTIAEKKHAEVSGELLGYADLAAAGHAEHAGHAH